MNRFITTEPAKCIGCLTCEIACVLAHESAPDIETLSPTNFEPRLHVVHSFQVSTPVTCHQCDDAPCLNACPSGAILYSRGTVQVNQTACFGCKNCVVACPFGAMDLLTHAAYTDIGGMRLQSGVKTEAHKCDLCVNRAAGPACVQVCPTKAIHVMDAARMEDTRLQRQQRSAIESDGYGLGVVASPASAPHAR